VTTDLVQIGMEEATGEALHVLVVENFEGVGVFGHVCESVRENLTMFYWNV